MKRQLENWIDSYLAYTENSEPPYLFHYWTAISVIASCLQRKCKFEWGTLDFYPNMYIVLVAPSGKARKGTALNVGYKLLRKLNIPMAAEAITREALIRAVKECQDTTVHPESGTVDIHCSLTVFSAELTVFLGYNNQQLMSDLTDWYDCKDRWTYRTKNMGTDEITAIWVNLIGATTPELVQATMPQTAIGGGLTSRIIFVYEERKRKPVPFPFIDVDTAELGKKLADDLEQIKLLRGKFKATPEFAKAYCNWYLAQEDEPPIQHPFFSGYIERRATHVMKLCMIFSAARDNLMHIDACDLERAISVLERTERKMIRTFAGVGKSQYSEIVERIALDIATKQRVEFRDLMFRFRSDVDKFMLERIIQSLEAAGYCRQVISEKSIYIQYTPSAQSLKEYPLNDVEPA